MFSVRRSPSLDHFLQLTSMIPLPLASCRAAAGLLSRGLYLTLFSSALMFFQLRFFLLAATPGWPMVSRVFFFHGARVHPATTVSRRGYADLYSRDKPHMNIGTIGACMDQNLLATHFMYCIQAMSTTGRPHSPPPSPKSLRTVVGQSSLTTPRLTRLRRRRRVESPSTRRT